MADFACSQINKASLPSCRTRSGIQPTRVCAANRVFSAQGLGLAGPRLEAGVTKVRMLRVRQKSVSSSG
ncbi:hypothetical protein CFBP7129_17255 [Agrobacterium tumefaciens]|uniref:Uncharacterized protein n=1 Tax=Agrobacterium tumefaciens TaxID=358 RepID=A0A4D7YEU0_AGRTU|nr:hypothetical protein CFBP7129_17255 [Agrobacterium tumefaciens]